MAKCKGSLFINIEYLFDKVCLYGSQATNLAIPSSDIDLVIEINEPIKKLDECTLLRLLASAIKNVLTYLISI